MNTLKAEKVSFTDTHLNIELNDGRIVSTPIVWYPKLQNATINELKHYRFICRATGIEWEDLDYHLSIESMLHARYIPKAKKVA